MGSWEESLGELRAEFVLSARQRIDRMVSLLRSLAASPQDPELPRELMLQFHGLAGAGTTYGFPEVTRLGLAGERLLGGREAPAVRDPAVLPALEGLIAELRRALELDAAVAEQREAAAAVEPPPRPLVLVVEGDDDSRELIAERLQHEGYDVRAAATRGLAEAALEERVPDAVVCDLMLPDGSGFDVISAVRRLPDGDFIPILIASVQAGFMDKVEALTSGADAYFAKPVDWDGLLRRLQHLLERRRLEPARVLCVEEFQEQAAYLRTVLVSAGYVVETLSDPRGFEAALVAFRPDLVLMDVLLPGVSGYDLTRFLRQHPRFASVPVVFLTTEAHPEARIRSLKAGADDHLVEPVTPALLLTAVASHLERARLLRSLTERDGLTRLLTHSAFLERAKEAWERARQRPELRPALVMMDLDAFKLVNDRYGHAAGDAVLVAFAALLRRRLRHSDVVGRYGGEEFALVLEGLEPPDATRLANRLREEFGSMEQTAPDESRFKVTLSAGVSALDAESMSFEQWRKAADDALYAAKAQGRDRVVSTPLVRLRKEG